MEPRAKNMYLPHVWKGTWREKKWVDWTCVPFVTSQVCVFEVDIHRCLWKVQQAKEGLFSHMKRRGEGGHLLGFETNNVVREQKKLCVKTDCPKQYINVYPQRWVARVCPGIPCKIRFVCNYTWLGALWMNHMFCTKVAQKRKHWREAVAALALHEM